MGIGRALGVFVGLLGVCGIGIAQNAESPTVVQGAPTDRAENAPGEAASLGMLPASFEGDLPAADGPRIFYHLNLFPGRAFILRRTKLGPEEDPPLDVIGTWAVSADGARLKLKDAHRVPIVFAITDGGDLRMLDAEERVMEPYFTYSLTRLESFTSIEPRLFLRGLYSDTAEGAIFQECATGWRLLVAEDGDYAAMEFAYSRTRHEPGEPLFVTLRGRIAQGHDASGAGTRMLLAPERFLGMWPGETCDPPDAAN